MRLLIQRSAKASVKVEEKVIGAIDTGMVVFAGFTHTDTPEIVEKMATKLLNLRIFPDENKPMNRAISDSKGQILLISQFTLYGTTKKGNRPSFIDAMEPNKAEELFNLLVKKVSELHSQKIATGQFGAHMEVELINDGPTTIMLEN